tara:strand:- start:62 stop:538 length:477 start_codon:yes stop_codon:yes gene_type:complete
MNKSYTLRELCQDDITCAKDIYIDAIESQGDVFYNKEQISAWTALARLPGILDKPLKAGKGWVSIDNGQIQAFAVRYPTNRLALLYCRGCSARQGHATSLLMKIERQAIEEKQIYLFTEASLFSFPLLKKYGWKLNKTEKIFIGGISFERYLMKKKII